MKIRMTAAEEYLGADATESDVENFKAAAEQAAAGMGRAIEWIGGTAMDVLRRDDEESAISEQIFEKSIKIGW